jgi:hypothetical protein
LSNIIFQQESYKRGMVLGLTMAEIVLLILFTLLLVLSALLLEKERESKKLMAQIALIEKKISPSKGSSENPTDRIRIP